MELPIYTGATVAARLAALGLDEDTLRRAVLQGEIHRRACTPNDPGMMCGILRWGKTVRSLRDSLSRRGWTSGRDGGYETVDRPDGALSIVVMTGDSLTGVVDDYCSPRSQYPKGSATVRAIRQNNLQTRFSFYDLRSDPGPEAVPWATWVLLVHTGRDEIRCELSLPESLDSVGRIFKWRERIVLDSVPREDDPIGRTADDEDDIDFDVDRIAG